jgi:hypothetical protein
MALQITLRINRAVIGDLLIRRVDPPGSHLPADTIGLYEWALTLPNLKQVTSKPDDLLAHRYGDGAWALVSKVLDVAMASDDSIYS